MTTEGAIGAEHYECCETEVRTVKFEYKWIIRNFLQTFNKIKLIKSSSFAIKDCPLTGWIEIYPPQGARGEGSQPHAEIYIPLTRTDSTRLSIHTEGSVMDSQGMKQLIFITNVCGYEVSYPYDLCDAVIRCSHRFPVNDLFPVGQNAQDTVAMYFDFTIELLSSVPTDIRETIQLPMPECRSAYDFSELLEDPKYSDATITVLNRKFDVHRNILANRSSLFAFMFELKMEDNESHINITDMRAEVVEEMLKFIYTDKTEKVGEMTGDLLYAAEKYGLETLKALCVQSLRKNLNCYNAADSLILADQYDIKTTKVEISKFISKHRNLVENTFGYEVLRQKYPHLLLETYEIK